MQQKTIETWVGVFMLVGIAALVMLAFKVSGSAGTGGDVYRINARFENVGGLSVKAPVRIGGVKVGRVAEITIDKQDYSAIVAMDIAAYFDNIPIDSDAAILTSGLLGAQFVGIGIGGEEVFVESGEELETTQSAIQLETLISQFMFSRASGDSTTKTAE